MAKILLIDDDDSIRATTRSILESDGHRVEEAADGNIGIARTKSYGPDLILTDIIMPNMEGIEMIAELRRRGYGGAILAMSGGGRLGANLTLDLAANMGADLCIAKPFKRADLLGMVNACLTVASNRVKPR